MIRKGIQYFRCSQADETIRDVMLASLVMAHEQAKTFCEEMELWTDEEGLKVVDLLPVSWSSVRLLSATKNVNVADNATILAAQDCSFILLKEYVFVGTPLTDEKVDRDVFVYSTTTNAGNEYIYDTNIRELIDVDLARVSIPDWRTERGLNAAISGGYDYSFWKEYGLFVQHFLSANPKMVELSPPDFQYLIDSWLLKAFAKKKEVVIDVLEANTKRISEVRPPAALLKLHMPLPVVVVSPSILSFIDIQDFILSMFRVRHPSLWREFREAIPAREKLQHFSIEPPSSESYFFKDLSDDVVHYEARRTRLLNEISNNNDVQVSRHQLSIEEFRQSDNITVSTSKLTDVVKTKWAWRQGIRVRELGNLKWLANTAMPEGSYSTLISATSSSTGVLENSIDDLNEIILDVFTVPAPLHEGIQKVREYFDDPEDNKLFDAITIRMYDLYMLGALHVTSND